MNFVIYRISLIYFLIERQESLHMLHMFKKKKNTILVKLQKA